MATLDKASPIALFWIAVLLSVIQLRFVILMIAGTSSIAAATLTVEQTAVSLALLVLAIIWPQLLPILVYLVMGEKAQDTLNGMNTWLTRNQRTVKIVVLGLFGLILLEGGLSGLFGGG